MGRDGPLQVICHHVTPINNSMRQRLLRVARTSNMHTEKGVSTHVSPQVWTFGSTHLWTLRAVHTVLTCQMTSENTHWKLSESELTLNSYQSTKWLQQAVGHALKLLAHGLVFKSVILTALYTPLWQKIHQNNIVLKEYLNTVTHFLNSEAISLDFLWLGSSLCSISCLSGQKTSCHLWWIIKEYTTLVDTGELAVWCEVDSFIFSLFIMSTRDYCFEEGLKHPLRFMRCWLANKNLSKTKKEVKLLTVMLWCIFIKMKTDCPHQRVCSFDHLAAL